jgi:hypothetical protein
MRVDRQIIGLEMVAFGEGEDMGLEDQPRLFEQNVD